MRQFATGGFRIWTLSREAKLVYTGFGVFALLAIGISVLFYEDLVGSRSAGVAAYYAGESRAHGDSAAPAGGPAIELAPEGAEHRITVAVTYRKLLEVTHFHLFTVPVFLLIIAHIFMLTGLSPRAKAWWIAGAFFSSLLHLGAPWLVRYGSARLSPLFPVSGAVMALTLTVMTAYPLYAMWAPPKQSAS